MKQITTLFLGFSCLIGFAQNTSTFISHRVEANQTLYAIGRMYHISPQILMKSNPQYGPTFRLKTGSIVNVPNTEEKNSRVDINPQPTNNNTTPTVSNVASAVPLQADPSIHQERYAKFSTHIVRDGETIESIADEEKISTTDLIALNKNKIAHIKIGDALFIKEYWLTVENEPSVSIQQSSKEETILSTMTKEKYDNELLFMNENR
jgi:LysM repeat protein